MSAAAHVLKRTRKSGQTLVIALLILGVLLILGFVFLGLISRNIATGVRSTQRSIGNDLAEAGIRYAHGQLLRSGLGADWRVPLTPMDPVANQRDPDFDYLKPGGPDGLGNYGRVMTDQGRFLVRVRYGPTDANVFSNNPTGPLRLPGRAKNFIIIESLGKPGKINLSDPTTSRDITGADREKLQTRKLIAFASIGITEQAFFVTNKDNVSRAIEFGAPAEIGARFTDQAGPAPMVNVPTQLGDMQLMPNSGTPIPYGGSARFNGDVVFHGPITAFVNKYYGESILSSGSMVGADDTNASLTVSSANYDPVAGVWTAGGGTLTNPGAQSLDSRSPNFNTITGLVRDGFGTADAAGYTRGNRANTPPSFWTEDATSGELVYRTITRDSGIVQSQGNSGAFGHGRMIYVNNFSDRQNRSDEQGREIKETEESLVYDWLNPNNGQAGSGWQGAFYVPRGAYVQLVPDGLLILRDSRGAANERTWRDPNGNDTTNSAIRYRIVRNGAGKLFIANTYSAFGGGVTINTATPAQVAAAGFPFDGVLYFEGNVRVRGTIPTDVQLTLISGGTIYVEGSITKGVVRTQAAFDQGGPQGQPIGTASRSMLMLAAKDFVAINTSQFFGTSPTQVIEEVNDLASALEFNPIRMRRQATPGTPDSYQFRTELLLNPDSGTPNVPSSWRAYGMDYAESTGAGTPINAGLLITHTMDDGPATNSFVSLDVNFGLDNGATANAADWQYLFDLNNTTAPVNPFDPYQSNNASDYAPYNAPGFINPGYAAAQADRGPVYGLGAESWQRYGKFETTFFPMIDSGGAGAFPFMPITQEHGTYQLLAQETNDFGLRFNDIGTNASNDYLIARAAMVPNDVRIEASLYAEGGSFFVIPSPWFNPNPNDRRDVYMGRVTAVGQAQADAERYQNYGAAPITPFYGEPIDVKVKIIGAVSQNMPAPMSQQAEWLKKWGWIPRTLGATGIRIPQQHLPANLPNTDGVLYVPNLIITYDPALGSGRAWQAGQPDPFEPANPPLRTDDDGRMLAPMPRLPVSPTLAYFGEVNQ